MTTIKTGATFGIGFIVKLPAGTWTVESDLRKTNDAKIADLTATLVALITPDVDGNTHSGTLSATAAQTLLWPVGTHRCDIKFTSGASVLISTNIAIVIEKAVTHD